MDDILRVEDRYYILSTSSLADDRVRVLKYGETFAVFDRRGDIEPFGQGVQGIYHEGTRYLSQWALRLQSGVKYRCPPDHRRSPKSAITQIHLGEACSSTLHLHRE